MERIKLHGDTPKEFIPSSYSDSEMVRKVREAFERVKSAQKYNTTGNNVDSELEEKLALLKSIPKEELEKLAQKHNTAENNVAAPEDEEAFFRELYKERTDVNNSSTENLNKESKGGDNVTSRNRKGEVKEAIEKVAEDIVGLIESKIREGQIANQPEPVKEKPDQRKVEMPTDEKQEEITTSEEDAKAAGKQTKAQQAELGEESEKEEPDLTVEKVKAEAIKKANEAARAAVKESARPKTDIDSGKLVVEGQQAELGEEGEKEEPEEQVGKRNLGDVKATGQKVATPEIKEKPDQRKVEMPVDEEQEEISLGESELPESLSGARKVTLPSGEQQTTIYTARFIRKPQKLDSYWKVSTAKGQPLFKISLEDAFGKGLDAVKQWPMFRSEAYGKRLVAELNVKGAKRVLDEYFSDGKRIYATFYKGAQVSGEPAEPGSVTEKREKPEIPLMQIEPEAEERIEKPVAKKGTPVVDLLVDVLAPIIAASETYDVNDVIDQLKSVFSDEESVSQFKGKLESEIEHQKEKEHKEGVSEEEKKVEAIFKVLGIDPNAAKEKVIELYKKIPGVNDFIKGLEKAYNQVKVEKAQLQKKLFALENEKVLREKARKAVLLAKLMLRKGVLKEEEYESKIKDLMNMTEKSFKEVQAIVEKLPDRKKKIVTASTDENVDVMDVIPFEEVETSLPSREAALKDVFTSVPEIDEDNRTVKK